MAKSALDKLKAMTNKDLVKKLDCPSEYGLCGIYNCENKNPDVTEFQCHVCWTKRI